MAYLWGTLHWSERNSPQTADTRPIYTISDFGNCGGRDIKIFQELKLNRTCDQGGLKHGEPTWLKALAEYL